MNYNSANNEAYEMNLNNIYQNPYNKNEQYEQSYTIEELKKIIYEEDKMNQNIQYFPSNNNSNYYYPQKFIKGLPSSITIEQMKEIIKQMERNAVKIYLKKGSGSGFFCNIPFPKKTYLLPVLITNNHVLNEEQISIGKTIFISMNNGKNKYSIYIDQLRKTYTSSDYDITIIEIKDTDNINNEAFLDIDDEVYNLDNNQIQKYNQGQESIYLLHYPDNSPKVMYSIGLIKNIYTNKYDLRHSCQSKEGSSGGPILKLINFKIIGIHKGASKTDNSNLGTFIKAPIDEFNKKFQGYNINKNNNIINKNELEKVNILKEIHSIDEIKIIYRKHINSNKIRIFGDKFIENNKDKCHIIYKGKQYILTSHITLNNKSEVEIQLRGINKIIDMEYIFEDCNSLFDIPDITNWNTRKVIKMNRMFSGCNLLKHIPNISTFDTHNVVDMSDMFSGCESLISLPDISNWDMANVYNLKGMFFNCKSLKSLPDISKWKINKVINMKSLFHFCSSLTSLPDISNWNTSKLSNMSNIFYDCKSLSELPDISKWNTGKVGDMNGLFFGCQSLKSLPDISKWKTDNVINMRGIFCACKLLNKLPGISKWNTHKVIDMSDMFSGCDSLLELPDISLWDTSNVINMGGMFFQCESLIELPDISKWNINKVSNIKSMFYNCYSLSSFPNISKWNYITKNVKNKECMFNNCKLIY